MIVKTVMARLLTALLAKPMAFWAMRYLVKQTDNELDDHAVELVISLVENDIDGARVEIKNLVEKLGR